MSRFKNKIEAAFLFEFDQKKFGCFENFATFYCCVFLAAIDF
jgi:hypothetical protein